MVQKKQSEKNIKGLVLTLRPDNAQKLLLDKHLNDTRFIYNQYVEEYLKAIKENRLPNYKDYQDLRAEHEFLKGSSSWTLQQVKFQFLKTNSINRSKRSKGQKVGLVKFRSKKSHSDYFYIQGVKLSYNSDLQSKSYIKIPKIGLVNFKCKNIKSEFLNGKIKTCTVKRTKTGVYKISLLVEVGKVYEDRVDNKHIGLDFSLRDFFVDSFGANAPEFSTKRSKMESLQEKIDSLNTTISKMRNKSKKKRKISVKVYRLTMKRNKLFERVHNIQVDYINKLSRDLCKHNELIVLEDLNLTEMSERTSFKDSKTSTKGGNHGKSIGLLQWSYFLKKLEENSEKFGNVIVLADKFFPSSQICSKCGERHSEMKDVTKRTLECKCGNIIDRDYNSALNLLKFGETVVYNKSYQTLGKELSEYKAFKCLDFQDQKHLNYSQVFDCK
jgi:putative transposase